MNAWSPPFPHDSCQLPFSVNPIGIDARRFFVSHRTRNIFRSVIAWKIFTVWIRHPRYIVGSPVVRWFLFQARIHVKIRLLSAVHLRKWKVFWPSECALTKLSANKSYRRTRKLNRLSIRKSRFAVEGQVRHSHFLGQSSLPEGYRARRAQKEGDRESCHWILEFVRYSIPEWWQLSPFKMWLPNQQFPAAARSWNLKCVKTSLRQIDVNL